MLALAVLGAGLVHGPAACSGCRTTTPKQPTEASIGAPTVRLYLLSDLAGALEPCGCTKDQLGGLDHLGAFLGAERAKAGAARDGVVSAGPLFFMEPVLKPDHAAQDSAKAETIAASLKGLGLLAFAPGKNDWAAGPAELAKLHAECGGTMLVANAPPQNASWQATALREINGVKVGLLGVSMPEVAGVDAKPPIDAVKTSIAALKGQGAQVLVALASVGRGEAKRIADLAPELTLILVGSPGGSGDQNNVAPPPERIGNVIIAETGNHLTSVGVLDLYVRGGSMTFADATGLEQGRKREELTRRIEELRVKIAAWERDGKLEKKDIDARKADVAKIEAERAALDVRPPPEQGSFFRYTTKEIRESLGKDPAITAQMLAYYKKVNDANKIAFRDRMPRPHTADEPLYVGIEVCSTSGCHEEARAVWDKTRHAKAYATLSTQFKEYNLDCVSCHVTGYDLPGGSTVAHTDRLQNVQCEVCHGPGGRHALNPTKHKIPIQKPTSDSCLACHHPPHVDGFDAKAKMEEILGPGHGKK